MRATYGRFRLFGFGRWLIASLLMWMLASTAAAEEPTQATIRQTAAKVRATSAEMNFIKLPWITDLLDGFKIASQEKRPVFLFLQTGDALDDC